MIPRSIITISMRTFRMTLPILLAFLWSNGAWRYCEGFAFQTSKKQRQAYRSLVVEQHVSTPLQATTHSGGFGFQAAASRKESTKRTPREEAIQPLKAAVIGNEYQGAPQDSYLLSTSEEKQQGAPSWLSDFALPVLSSALLITGNTFGAGSLVMPELAAGPGLAASTGIFLACYCMNLISGLVIAQVAITQKELAQAGDEVPSSFKQFAQVNLNSNAAAAVISSLSLFVNACVMSFDLSRVGTVASALTDWDSQFLSCMWGVSIVAALTGLSRGQLSTAASLCVAVLFGSFGALLLPGLAAVNMPAVDVFLQPGTAPDLLQSVAQASPIILMSLVYQNVIPTITKLLNYDRTKTVSAIVLGSAIPLTMYLAWCFACLGGGIDTTVSATGSGVILTLFTLATLTGSSIGCGISLAEEVDTHFGSSSTTVKPESKAAADARPEDVATGSEKSFHWASALTAVGVPAVAMLLIGTDMTGALSIAGGLGSPVLYGAIPALMAWSQQQRMHDSSLQLFQQKLQQQLEQQGDGEGFSFAPTPNTYNLVPTPGLGLLGLLSTGYVGEEIVQRVGEAMVTI